MFKNTLRLLLFWIIVFSMTSCYKKGASGPAGPTGAIGPTGPAYKGVITGHVSLYDEYGSKIFTGENNVTLSLKGGKTIATDSTGYYVFDSVTTGMYDITATCPGFATTVLVNFQFINDTLYKDLKMSAIPSFSISSFYATHNAGSAYDSLVVTAAVDSRPRNIIIFVSNKPSVSNLPTNYLYTYTKTINANAAVSILRVPANDLNSAGIFFGEPVYYAAYSYVVNDVSVYEDMITGNNVYNAISSPQVDSAICP